ncbi:histidine phosphatase family protein, partial [Candidatus Dojkabacteria bacterium]|nr:histidine phosphatase family protein [Candidatus Dojkabacteria bacterium]
MQILFIRHGESTDDLTDQLGGWADFPLTPKGIEQIKESAKRITTLNVNFDIVLASPLIRAQESGRILANEFSLPLETFLYLKEKNGYGLLSGLNKDYAKKSYPELWDDMQNGYVYGAEPEDMFSKRVKIATEKLIERSEKNIIAVTHGGFMKKMFDIVLGKDIQKTGDGGFALTRLTSSGLE